MISEEENRRLYFGYVDSYLNGLVRGWACSVQEPQRKVSIHVLCDGAEIGRVLAHRFREDLFAAGVGDGSGCYMFHFVIPEVLPVLTSGIFRLLADGVEELTGSPLQCLEQAASLYRRNPIRSSSDLSTPPKILPPARGKDDDLPLNSGLAILNEGGSEAGPKTVIVVGHARSGTSMVARALHIAGLPMGLPSPVLSNYEDKELVAVLRDAIEAPPLDGDRLDELICHRNSRHGSWGFKAPAALNSLSYLIQRTRNPHVVVVFRDILATSLRESLAAQADTWESLESSLSYEILVLRFLRNTDIPCLLVSYEKALMNPRYLCEQLARFTNLESDSDWMDRAVLEMNPSQRDYLEDVRDGQRARNEFPGDTLL